MPEKHINLIFAPPGKRHNLVDLFKELTDNHTVFDIEGELKKQVHMETQNLHVILSLFTRERIQEEWHNAITAIFNKIESVESDFITIIGHALYFVNNRREFYSVIDINHLKEKLQRLENAKISSVVLVIDDIFDTYASLKGGGELFSDTSFLSFLQDYTKNFKISNNELNFEVWSNWLHYCMSYLLSWRSQELILAQNFSRHLSTRNQTCSFMLWGLKQDFKSLLLWLKNINCGIFYVSHPISEPRSKQIQERNWKEPVLTINKLQTELVKKDISSVVPTAIDEYRFEKNGKNYTTSLHERWPVPEDVKLQLVNHTLIDSEPDKKNTFRLLKITYDGHSPPGKDDEAISETNQNFVNGALSSLETQIVEQLSNRDHTLVWATSGIIVIEPLGENLKLHGGVKKELIYLRQLNDAIFEDSRVNRSDLKKLFLVLTSKVAKNLVNDTEFKNEVRQEIAKKIHEKQSSIGELEAAGLIDSKLGLTGSSEGGALRGDVDATIVEVFIKPNYATYRKEAIAKIFLKHATPSFSQEKYPLNVLILDDLIDLVNDENTKQIKEFFEEGVEDGPWGEKLATLLE